MEERYARIRERMSILQGDWVAAVSWAAMSWAERAAPGPALEMISGTLRRTADWRIIGGIIEIIIFQARDISSPLSNSNGSVDEADISSLAATSAISSVCVEDR
eukprot:Gb_33948 [translate_table: standard]